MFKIDKRQLKQKLLERTKPEFQDAIDGLLDIFPESIPDELVSSYNQWLEDETLVDAEVDGVSVKEVMERNFTTVFGAISLVADYANRKGEEKETIKRLLLVQKYIE